MKLWLVGLMGSGKSTVGRLAAHRVGSGFLDTDDEIELVANEKIASIWSRSGETEFRTIESEVIRSAASSDGVIIATGGGAVIQAENRTVISATGTVIWMRVSPLVSLARMPTINERPLLSPGDAIQELTQLLDKRTSLYSSIADFEIDTNPLTLDQTVQAVVEIWNR